MGFLSVCTAVYDYQPQSAEELEIKEGELLFILENDAGDDWWKARKKAIGEDDDEPEGLIPNNYVEDAKPIHKAKALFDYTRQTDEEISFSEELEMDVFDDSDPDWTLVGANGEYGFAPSNYIEILKSGVANIPPPPPLPAASNTASTRLPSTSPSPDEMDHSQSLPTQSTDRDVSSAAANLAQVLGGGAPISSRDKSLPRPPTAPTAELSDEEEQAPQLPRRPPSQSISVPVAPPLPTTETRKALQESSEPPGIISSPPHNRIASPPLGTDVPLRSPGGFRLYSVSEMVSVMGRRRKMPTTLGLNIATGTIMISPEKTRDGPTQEWTADKLSHYSIESKHVFLELIRPSRSLDLHAGAKDTAQEIVSVLAEIAGAQKAEGIKEVIEAATSGKGAQKKGLVLYDFMAQGDDEVTVGVGDEVVILDDEKSEEWWNVRRLKNGSEGVMPASYIEITGIVTAEPSGKNGINAGRSRVEQNRMEEERLTREAVKATQAAGIEKAKGDIELPERGSSLTEEDPRKHKDRRASRADGKTRSKPDPKKLRVWTDRSGEFKVEAQFIGIADGKIHLHKTNGVKIAVLVTKMSPEDIEYVEKVTHESIEEHIPVADLIKLKRKSQAIDSSANRSGASIEPTRSQPKKGDYDWFEFFLAAGVGPHQCERYAQAMVKDSMDESVLPDITTDTLRAIGIKEGDALKVMKHLDQQLGRSRTGVASDVQGGIFSGPGGALHNNTRRGRPEANRQTNDVVDASTFSQNEGKEPQPITKDVPPSVDPSANNTTGGFDDNAWEVKPSVQGGPSRPQPVISSALAQPALSENLQALSLLDKPLEPTPAPSSKADVQVGPPTGHSAVDHATQSPLQQTGANPAFFTQLQPQMTAVPQRQRPLPPQQTYTGPALLPPPPRPTSAPQNPQQNQFGLQPLQPQLTGLPISARPAGAGQSLEELNAQRLQQQYLQAQPTGYTPGQPYGQYPSNGLMPQPTGFQPQPGFDQFRQPFSNGNVNGGPFADPRSAFLPQPTGYGLQPGPAPGSLNSVLPPAMVPQKTGYQPPAPQLQLNGYGQGLQPQATGYQPSLQSQPTGFGQVSQHNGFNAVQLPPMPPMPQQSPAPLIPQKTGPAPNIKFGVKESAKLVPQPTGRRANLAHATPQNPFGF